jgi:predicted GTPase
MISTQDPRQKFLSAMNQLSGKFAAVGEEVKAREAILMSELDALMDRLSKPLGKETSAKLHDDNPLAQAAIQADLKIVARLSEWKTRVERYNRNTALRKDFGDSLLVFVYGKVKAGKSSLGNYVAYGHGDPDPAYIDASDKAHYFMRAASNNSELTKRARELKVRSKFAVGATDTTTEIQGFRLPGLTWIDSPGIHSVTDEHGALSKEYASSADLIIYPMNSGQPGRASDLDEVKDLLQERKPFLVVITRCDTTDIDFDMDGNKISTLLMKDARDRQDQIEYVSAEILSKAGSTARELLDSEVLTVSVRYAQENGGDPIKLRESGLADLFEKLTTLSTQRGVLIKQQTPLNNLRAFVEQILDGDLSIDDLRESIGELKESLAKQRNGLSLKQNTVWGRVMLELNPLVEAEVNRHRSSRDLDALSKSCGLLIQEVVTRHISEALSEVLVNVQASINSAVKFYEFQGLPEYKDLTEDILLSNKTKGRTAGGIIGMIALNIGVVIATWGQSLWVQIPAGIAAVEIGRRAGAKLGEAAAGDSKLTILVGDNIREVIVETLRIAERMSKSAIENSFRNIDIDFLAPVEARSNDVLAALDAFKAVLKEKVLPK